MEFKKFNYIDASKKFCNHFHYICLYHRHTHYGISQRQHVFRVYVIHSNCARLHNFFSLWWTMVKMAIYTQKCEQKWLRINNNKRCHRWKKIEKLTIRGVGKIIQDSRVCTALPAEWLPEQWRSLTSKRSSSFLTHELLHASHDFWSKLRNIMNNSFFHY